MLNKMKGKVLLYNRNIMYTNIIPVYNCMLIGVTRKMFLLEKILFQDVSRSQNIDLNEKKFPRKGISFQENE